VKCWDRNSGASMDDPPALLDVQHYSHIDYEPSEALHPTVT